MLSILLKTSSTEYTLFASISSIPFCNFSFKSFLLFIVTVSGASKSKYDIFKNSIDYYQSFMQCNIGVKMKVLI